MSSKQDPLLVVRPIFNPKQTLVRSLVMSIILTVFFGSLLIPILGIALGSVIISILPMISDSITLVTKSDLQKYATIFTSVQIFIGVGLYVIITLIVYSSIKRKASSDVFMFYESYLTYLDSNNRKSKIKYTVNYSQITDISLSFNKFQEHNVVGTISISTYGSINRISISNISNPEDVHQRIIDLTHPYIGSVRM